MKEYESAKISKKKCPLRSGRTIASIDVCSIATGKISHSYPFLPQNSDKKRERTDRERCALTSDSFLPSKFLTAVQQKED